ncbi:hypothetical protein OSB04_017809, partial [Centaurea solstitialis]
MRRASTLAAASASLSRAVLASSDHQYNRLFFQATSLYATTNAASSRRWFSTGSMSTGGSSGAAKVFLSLGCVAVVGAGVLVGGEAYAKEAVRSDLVPKEVVLYQYESCPFCNKITMMCHTQVVEVNPLSKKEIKWSDYKKVPILMVDGEPLQDSSVENQAQSQSSTSHVDVEDEEKKWRRWVDDHLVHMLSPNIYRNTSEALESFDYITSNGNFSFSEKYTVKYAGAAAMYFVSKKLKKKYNITDERTALYEAAETWVNALDGREFLGGTKPNLADLAVFGVLRPIRYLRSGKDMVEHTRIGEWYTRMEEAV